MDTNQSSDEVFSLEKALKQETQELTIKEEPLEEPGTSSFCFIEDNPELVNGYSIPFVVKTEPLPEEGSTPLEKHPLEEMETGSSSFVYGTITVRNNSEPEMVYSIPIVVITDPLPEQNSTPLEMFPPEEMETDSSFFSNETLTETERVHSIPLVVKTEPLPEESSTSLEKDPPEEKQSGTSSFCYESVTKEELIIEDTPELVNGYSIPFVVKTEPLPEEGCTPLEPDSSEEKEASSFVFEAVTKEEVIIEDELVEQQEEEKQIQPKVKQVKQVNQVKPLRPILPKPLSSTDLSEIEKSRNAFLAHIKSNTALEKLYKCTFCRKFFPTKSCLKKHMPLHEKTHRFKCYSCNKKFVNRATLVKHIKRHGWNETKLQYLEKLIEDEAGIFRCSICEETLRKRAAITHVFRHMNIIEGIFKCKKCGMRCGDNREYKIHVQVHKKPRTNTSAAETSGRLRGAREEQTTGPDQSSAFECKLCRKVCTCIRRSTRLKVKK